MLLKTIFLAVVFYFVLKVALNLWRILQGAELPDGRGGGARLRSDQPPQQPTRQRERATRYQPKRDVEDATWEDIS